MSPSAEAERNDGGDSPVFVRGLSRSGGTLVVTMLDAHPNVSMSYELYPNLLEDMPEDRELVALARTLSATSTLPTDLPDGPRRFLVRTSRGGLTLAEVATLIESQIDDGMGFSSTRDRVAFLQRCGVAKMAKEGKQRWGAKCNSRYADYTDSLPSARFINVVRDGRDVLASQQNTGGFAGDAAKLARSWLNTHRKFRQWVKAERIVGLEVSYEELVQHPAAMARTICSFLGEDFDPSMLQFHQMDLSIFGASHLSMDRISKPVDTSKIGRWRRELSSKDVAQFEAIAGAGLTEFGYELS